MSSIFFEIRSMFYNFWLSQSEQPNFGYPQMHNDIKKSSLLHSYSNEPFHIQKNPFTIERTHLKMPKLSKKAIFIKEYEAMLASRVVKHIDTFVLMMRIASKMRSMIVWLQSWLCWSHHDTSFRVHICNGIAIGNSCSMMASTWQMMSFCLTFTWINLCHAIKQAGGRWSRV